MYLVAVGIAWVLCFVITTPILIFLALFFFVGVAAGGKNTLYELLTLKGFILLQETRIYLFYTFGGHCM